MALLGPGWWGWYTQEGARGADEVTQEHAAADAQGWRVQAGAAAERPLWVWNEEVQEEKTDPVCAARTEATQRGTNSVIVLFSLQTVLTHFHKVWQHLVVTVLFVSSLFVGINKLKTHFYCWEVMLY